MANTYSQVHLQFVFGVKYRQALIHDSWKDELYKYITGIVSNNKHKMLAINGVADHIHIFIGMRPHQSVSDLLRDIKANSAKWINERKFVAEKFEWQEGYGVFSYDMSAIDNVIRYIQNQESHHKAKTFREEYHSLLEKFEIEFDERYTFKEAL
jgi:REP element-mobilizing transposase RayT